MKPKVLRHSDEVDAIVFGWIEVGHVCELVSADIGDVHFLTASLELGPRAGAFVVQPQKEFI
jgi:hypothetical protein